MSADRTLELIRTLHPSGQNAAIWLINALRSEDIPAIVISARRTAERQRALIRAGRTIAVRSKHLVGRALDIGSANESAWRPGTDHWFDVLARAGSLWESIGGRWGGRFADWNHFDW